MTAQRRPWFLLAIGLATMAGVQLVELADAGWSPDAAISIGPLNRSTPSLIGDLVLAIGAVITGAAFAAARDPDGLTVNQRRLVAGEAAFLLIAVLLWIVAPDIYVMIGNEDRLLEWLQTALLFTAAGLVQMASLRLRDAGVSLARWLAQFGAFAFFFIGGEEISWGQRIFGFESTGAFATANEQAETTLHNFATIPLDIAYFVATIVLVIVLPLWWHHGGLRERVSGTDGLSERWSQVAYFIPSPWVALATAPAAGVTHTFWNVLPVQAGIGLTLAVVATLWWRRATGPDRAVVGLLLVAIAVSSLAELTLGRWDLLVQANEEYREFFMTVGFAAWGIDLLARAKAKADGRGPETSGPEPSQAAAA